MGRFDNVLLVSDFDNTLIYTEESLLKGIPIPPLPERNRAALERFMAEGGRFTVATGRALAAFVKYAPLVPMNAPAVVCNGAAIYDFEKGEYLETAMLDGQARQRGQAVLDRFPDAAVEAYHIDNVIHAVHPNEITRNHEHLTKVGVTEMPSLLDVPLPLGKLLFEASPRDAAGDPGLPGGAGLERGLRADLLRPEPAGDDRPGRRQGRHGPPAGGPAGHPHGPRLLRGGRGQRPVHADRGGGGLCPRQLRRRRAGERRRHRVRRPGGRSGGRGGASGAEIPLKKAAATTGCGSSSFRRWRRRAESGILNVTNDRRWAP